MFRLTFHGAAKEVTGSNYLIESGDTKILVDCGMFQGGTFCEPRNYEPFGYDPKEIAAVVVTHAHLDHTGRLPKLFREGFRGKVFVTPPTRDLTELILDDSADLIGREAERDRHEPLYSRKDVEGVVQKCFTNVAYDEPVQIAPDITFQFHDAGHILGSAVAEVSVNGRIIVFSGDLGNAPTPLLAPPTRITEADYLVIESTHGNRIHEDRDARRQELEDVIEDTVAKRGVLLLPAFALERTQEILFELNTLAEHRRIPQIPVYIDSPLAIKATAIYHAHQKYFNGEARLLIRSGDDLFKFPNLHFTETSQQSKEIANVPSPKMILAGSGMSTGGRILHHEKRYLPGEENTLLIISFQAERSRGRRLLEGAGEIEIMGEMIPVRARVVAIGGYSAHADQQQLIDWVRPMRARLTRVVVTHGEEKPAEALAGRIRDELAIDAIIPSRGDSIVLE